MGTVCTGSFFTNVEEKLGRDDIKKDTNGNWVWLPERSQDELPCSKLKSVFRTVCQDRVQLLQYSWEQDVPMETTTSCSKASDFFFPRDLSPNGVSAFQDILMVLFSPLSLHLHLCPSTSSHSLNARCWLLMPQFISVVMVSRPSPFHTYVSDCSKHSHVILMEWNTGSPQTQYHHR